MPQEHVAPLSGMQMGKVVALFADVVAAQLAQRVGDEFACDPFAPGHVEIRVIKRLGNASRERRRITNRVWR